MIDKSSFVSKILCVDQLFFIHYFKSKERILFIEDGSNFLFWVIDHFANILDNHIVFIDGFYKKKSVPCTDFGVADYSFHSHFEEDFIIPTVNFIIFFSFHTETFFIELKAVHAKIWITFCTIIPTNAVFVLTISYTGASRSFNFADLRIAEAVFITEL
jgi:hypothetical protein